MITTTKLLNVSDENQDLVKRLLKHSYEDPVTKCWIWTGAKNSDGYGNISFRGKMYGVNRVSCYLYHGLDLEDIRKMGLHKPKVCENKSCWNPDHLYVGDMRQNRHDYFKDHPHTFCKHGHPLNGTNVRFWQGEKICRTCTRERMREYRKVKKT